MKEYIEREAAKAAIRAKFKTIEERTEINEALNAVPAADVVEVIRCKDCMFWYRCPGKREVYACEVGGMNCILNGEGFCSRAKRGKSFMREE